jgi:cell division protease FtsH
VNNQWFSKVAVWLVIALVLFTVFKQFDRTATQSGMIGYSDFLEEVRGKRIKSVQLQDVGGGSTEIRARTSDDKELRTTATVLDRGLVGDLINNNVKFDVKPREEPSFLLSMLASWGPILLLIGVWVYFMRQMQGGGKGGAFTFGKSKARMLDEANNTTTFADVAGCDEAKEEVKELVDFLKDPQKFQKLGGRIPRACCWSALRAPARPCSPRRSRARRRCRSSRSRVPTSSRCSSASARRACATCSSRRRKRALHHLRRRNRRGRPPSRRRPGRRQRRARADAEPDAGRDGRLRDQRRRDRDGGHQPARHPRPALLRPGRFDRQVYVTLPDVRGREQILNVHMRKVPVGQDIRADILARGTPGFSGADLANLVNEAALFAARRSGRVVEMVDFERAKDKIMMGPERKSMLMPEEERATRPTTSPATRWSLACCPRPIRFTRSR